MTRTRCLVAACAVAGLVGARPAAGDAPPPAMDYFARPAPSSAVTVRRERARTPSQRLAIAGLLVGAAAGVGAGAWFHLDSRDAAEAVSGNDGARGEAWTAAWQATYERAGTSGTRAVIGYSIGAGFLAAALAVAWRTRPGDEAVVIEPDGTRPAIAPTPGGAVLSLEGRW